MAVSRVREGESGYEYVVAYRENTRIHRDIVVTEVDLANLIRAKAALYAGCKVLLEDVGLTFHDVERIFIAGGFGHYIDIEKPKSLDFYLNCLWNVLSLLVMGLFSGQGCFSFSKGFMEEAEKYIKNDDKH